MRLYSIKLLERCKFYRNNIIVFLCVGATEYFYENFLATKILKNVLCSFQIRGEPVLLCICSEKAKKFSGRSGLTVVNSGRVLFPFDLEEEKNLILFQGNTTSNLFGKADSCIHSSYLKKNQSGNQLKKFKNLQKSVGESEFAINDVQIFAEHRWHVIASLVLSSLDRIASFCLSFLASLDPWRKHTYHPCAALTHVWDEGYHAQKPACSHIRHASSPVHRTLPSFLKERFSLMFLPNSLHPY